jgi:hypothetical protein
MLTIFWLENLKVANIRMDLREIGWEVVDWMHLALCRDQWWALMNMVMVLRFP